MPHVESKAAEANTEPDQKPQTIANSLCIAAMSNHNSEIQPFELLPPTVLLVAEKSAYLNARIQPLAVRGNDVTIELPDVEPAALRLYVWWLQYENAPLHLHEENGPVVQPRQTLIWRECLDLIQAHLVGSKFGDVDFQRYILGQLDAWLDPQQNPDPELLNYLWEKDRDVGDELMCFVMARMFQMGMEKARMLVSWIKGLAKGKRMMNFSEGIRESRGRGPATSTRQTYQGPKSSSEKVEEVVPLEPTSRDRTPPELYRKSRAEVPTFGGATQEDCECTVPAPSQRKPSSRRSLSSPSSGIFTVPGRELTQRASTSQAQLENLPQVLRIHPKTVASTNNTSIHAEMERQRIFSPQLPPPPSLHPSIHRAMHSTPTPARSQNSLRTPQEKDHEMRGGVHSTSPAGNTATMPDAALSLLDFWVDPPANPALQYTPPDRYIPTFKPPPTPPKVQPAWPQSTVPLTLTTKQVLHSFSVTRTPTPRRRATRSWSVVSIHPSSHYLAYSPPPHSKIGIDRPARGIIGRKPVPEGGLNFLKGFQDGE
ncbi:hypothetical protein DPSP01_001824 [Paraphaeosphaeria sporulosa]